MKELKMFELSTDIKVQTYDEDTMLVLANHAASQRFLEWDGIYYSVMSFTTPQGVATADALVAWATLRYVGEVE